MRALPREGSSLAAEDRGSCWGAAPLLSQGPFHLSRRKACPRGLRPLSVRAGGLAARLSPLPVPLLPQAKERELELKNTWSENKLSRRQTQAKYGF